MVREIFAAIGSVRIQLARDAHLGVVDRVTRALLEVVLEWDSSADADALARSARLWYDRTPGPGVSEQQEE